MTGVVREALEKRFCQVRSISLWTRSGDHQGARSEKTELQTMVVTQEGRAPVTPTVNLRDRREADNFGREMPGLSLSVYAVNIFLFKKLKGRQSIKVEGMCGYSSFRVPVLLAN